MDLVDGMDAKKGTGAVGLPASASMLSTKSMLSTSAEDLT